MMVQLSPSERNPDPKKHDQDLWNKSANVNKLFGLFITHSFTSLIIKTYFSLVTILQTQLQIVVSSPLLCGSSRVISKNCGHVKKEPHMKSSNPSVHCDP